MRANYSLSSEFQQSQLLKALLLSLLIHLAFILFLPSFKGATVDLPRLVKVNLQTINDVSSAKPRPIAPKPPDPKSLPSTQIISPPEKSEDIPEKPTPYKAEADFRAQREQIKRGDGGPRAGETIKPRQAQEQNSRVEPRTSEPTSKRKIASKPVPLSQQSLQLSERSLAQLALNSATEAKPKEQAREQLLREYKPFQSSGGNMLPGFQAGVPDFLPNIPDGDITLLNAKADKHAIFVRRVATQVFGILRRLNWQSLPYGEIRRLSEMTTIHAILSPQGKLISVQLENSSGSSAFDNVVLNAARDGANDQNPPAGARAEDGNIHFVFKSQSWARPAAGPAREQRWLLLATGLL